MKYWKQQRIENKLEIAIIILLRKFIQQIVKTMVRGKITSVQGDIN